MLVSFDEAQSLVLEHAPRGSREAIALEAALGRVLREDIIARDDLVPFARSAMDGFAVRAEDTARSLMLALQPGAVSAGAPSVRDLAPGTAIAIATGAPLPHGANAVLPFERAVRENGSVRIDAPLRAGEHVFPPGDDARAGDMLARAGERLTPGRCALLASAGIAEVSAAKAMRVAVLCTGDELVDADRPLQPGQVRNSNLVFLAGALRELGADVVLKRTVPDDPAQLETALTDALAVSDLIVTTGGASVGERDYVKPALKALGARLSFDSVAMRPGRPSAFGLLGACAIAALPGNPSAVFVTFHELLRLCVGTFHGEREPRLARVKARLLGRLHAKPERTYFPFLELTVRDGFFEAEVAVNQCSALNRNAAQTNGLGVVRPGAGVFAGEDSIDVDVFDWSGCKERRS